MGGKTMSKDAFLAKLGSAKGYTIADDNNSGSINQREWADFFDRVDRNGSESAHEPSFLFFVFCFLERNLI